MYEYVSVCINGPLYKRANVCVCTCVFVLVYTRVSVCLQKHYGMVQNGSEEALGFPGGTAAPGGHSPSRP